MTARRLVAEGLGTALLLVAIVGSGIVTSSDGPASTQLFQHALVVGLALVALIHTFGHVSGAHFNPAVTLLDLLLGNLPRRLAAGYVVVQLLGACAGVVVTNLLFGEPAVALATTQRSGVQLAASELLATAGLLVVIVGVVRSGRDAAVPGAVGAYIAMAAFSTSSASFANPAVTVARSLSDTWTGIDPSGVPVYVGAQLLATVLVWPLLRWLFSTDASSVPDLVVPHAPPASPPRLASPHDEHDPHDPHDANDPHDPHDPAATSAAGRSHQDGGPR